MKICLIASTFLSTLSRRRCFANETAPAEVDATAAVFLANESMKNDGWVQLAPYGDWPNTDGLQRFGIDDAKTIVNEFQRLRNLPQRLLGLPWYIGHPDHPAFEKKYTDKRAYGRIKELEARVDGLFANIKWSPDGKKLVEDEAFHGHSVNWRMQKRGAVWHPIGLKSVGFTNDPQIPVAPAMANENQNQIMPPWIKTSLVTAGLVSADATDEQVKDAFMKFMEGQKAAQTAMANETSLRTAAEAQVTTLTAEITTLKGAKNTAEATLANERTSNVKVLLDLAEKDGRVKPTERGAWEKDFANEFTATATKLSAAKSTLKTKSKFVSSLAQTGAGDKAGQVRDFVNEEMKKNGNNYDAAFMKVRKEKPELFERDRVS